MMRKPVIIIVKAGHLSDAAYAAFRESILNLDDLNKDYHVLITDGAEYTHAYFFNENDK